MLGRNPIKMRAYQATAGHQRQIQDAAEQRSLAHIGTDCRAARNSGSVQILAEFRHGLRMFLQFCEAAATSRTEHPRPQRPTRSAKTKPAAVGQAQPKSAGIFHRKGKRQLMQDAQGEQLVNGSTEETISPEVVSRRKLLGMGSAAVAAAALAAIPARAQTAEGTAKAEKDRSSSILGPENDALLNENPDVNTPPPTDHGDFGAIWYSFDLARKRVQEGGWTHQVTQRELPLSKDLAGVNMRLTAGSFRELHWHTANEWAYMEAGKARVTVLNPDGTMFVDDIEEGDLWFFPAGYPHSIQGLGEHGCQFLLVFDEGNFSEDGTFLLSEFVAHTPPEILEKNSNLS